MPTNSSTQSGITNRKAWPYRKLLILASVGVAGGVMIWCGQEDVQQRPTTASYVARSASGNNAESANNSSVVSILPADRQSPTTQALKGNQPRTRNDNGAGLFNESARTLMHSNVLAKIDYGRHRATLECRSLAYHGDGIGAVRANTLPAENTWLHFGDATEAMRLAGFSRSMEKCGKLFGGVRYSSEEMVATSALPGVAQVEAIRMTLRAADDFDDPKTKVALLQAVTEPMLSTLGSLLLNKLDYSELAKSYGENGATSLQNLVFELVLCRMGDDCDRGGIVTEQLCWQSGICGDRVEDAIFASLRDRGLDTTALNQFVTRVQQSLVAGDTSIFRKPKSGK